MRMTHLAATGQLGGAERVLLECIHALSGTSHSLVALGPGPLIDSARRAGVEVRVVMPPPELSGAGDAFGAGVLLRSAVPIVRKFPAFFNEVSTIVSELAPDVIHSHGIKTHVLGALTGRRVPLVWHLHDYIGMRSVSSRLLRLVANRATLAIAVSESIASDARGVLPASLPVHVIHNAVDVERFTPAGPSLDLDRLSSLPMAAEGTIRIGLPATFAKWKGQDVFIEAIAKLNRPDVRGYIIGGPVYDTQNSQWSRAELETIVHECGLAGRIGFTGTVDDMPAVYRALDVVVHASTRPEPFGLVIAEAMSCGRAVIAAPHGGAGELFEDGVHAVAATGGDPAALESAIGVLAAAPDKRTQLGRQAREKALLSFGRDRFTTQLHATLAEIQAPLAASVS